MVDFVLPEFTSLYANLNLALPQSTLWLLDLADWGPYFIQYFCLILFATILLFSYAWQRPGGRFKIEQSFFRVPLIRACLIAHHEFLMAQQLGLLLKAGASLINALEFIRTSTKSPSFALYLSQVQMGVREGLGLRRSFCLGVYQKPRLALLLAHAEQTGQLDKVFLSLAEQHKANLSLWQERGKHFLQPIITLILGGFLGFWILLLYYPMLQLGTNLG